MSMNRKEVAVGPSVSKSRTNCCVPQCTSYHAKDRSLSFHSFPRQEDLRKQWIHVLKLGKKPGVAARVCSKHFESTDIKNTGKKLATVSIDLICASYLFVVMCLLLII